MEQVREMEGIQSEEVLNDKKAPVWEPSRMMKRVRLTVVYRTSIEVRSYSIKALTKKSRHLKLLRYLQKTVGVSNKKSALNDLSIDLDPFRFRFLYDIFHKQHSQGPSETASACTALLWQPLHNAASFALCGWPP